MALTDSAKKAKQAEIARRLLAISTQDTLVKTKRKAYRAFAKMTKQNLKGKPVSAQITTNNILNSKKNDIYRANQRLLAMRADLAKFRKQN